MTEPDAAGTSERAERMAIDIRSDGGAWSVAIVEDGVDVSVRACRDEDEARTYASTVRQHLAWLSPQKFREYYRLRQGARGAQEASAEARAAAPRSGEA